ncbi:MAG: 5'-methylthioadenosine/adenosylhomocysteine nucleosidase [Wolinella sp.]
MRVAILGAMTEEVTPLLESLGEHEVVEFAGNRYYLAHYHGLELVIAYSKIGKVNAALTASSIIMHFGCERLIFSGVAGAINENLKIGDLIIASSLCQHDVDITAFGHAFGFLPEGELFIKSDSLLNELAHCVAKEQGIVLREGIIATGDQFIADPSRKEWIRTTFGADALEMEGASVASVCSLLGVPFCVLRAISDAADMDAGFNFDEFLISSAKNSAHFVLAMLDKLSKEV